MTAKYLLDNPLDTQDLEIARTRGLADVCFTANVIAARSMRIIDSDNQIDELLVPDVCDTCLCDMLQYILNKQYSRNITISQVSFEQTSPPSTFPKSAESFMRVGLVGNPLLVFDEFLNEQIADKLSRLGVGIVWPDVALLNTDDVRYIEQLTKFYGEGVRDVIYLQSFSCLKGHVSARGALHGLMEQFPGLKITVLDYDPESSALNRENRIRLAVEQIKNHEI